MAIPIENKKKGKSKSTLWPAKTLIMVMLAYSRNALSKFSLSPFFISNLFINLILFFYLFSFKRVCRPVL